MKENVSVKSLAEPGIFAVLVVMTQEGEVLMRPIGGRWGAGIVDAVQEMAQRYPNCKMRLFEQNYRDWKMYFEGIIAREQML